jgi:dipeptidyl aminopeptidase/acylaminoacyl peptidase
MQAADLPLMFSAGRPALLRDGRVLTAVSHPDLDANLNHSKLVLIQPDGGRRDFTSGPRDSDPVLSPDGSTVVFARAGESGPPQLYAMPVDGGEARRLTDHKLGAGSVTFSPDGSRIAYLAAVPEEGRYGTDDNISAEAEAPRRLTAMSYRRDGQGFTLDKPAQVFVIDLAHDPADKEAAPAALTAEPRGAGRPLFLRDGSRIVYSRATGPDDITSELVTVATDQQSAPTAPESAETLVTGLGSVEAALVVDDTVYFAADAFSGNDFPGRNTGLWSVPAGGGTPRRLTDEEAVLVDATQPRPAGSFIAIGVLNRGAVELRAVPADADGLTLDELPLLIGGQRVVRDFDVDAANGRLAAVVGDPTSFAEIITADVDADLPDGPATSNERVVTDLGADLQKAGLGEVVELTGAGPDGYPVHGWLVLPAGDGPHPVLLNVHGGPHAAYSWSLFDEAQIYAGAGYAVVMGNPRGSAGYGQRHGRAVVKAMGTVDVDDVLALLDAALERDDLDGDRVGVMGGSYGGFMTSWLASHAGERFVAGISERAVNAWDSFSGASDIGHFFAEAYVGADRDTQWEHSPLAYADKIDMPLLIIHSEQDWRCPLEQGQRLFTALKLRDADTEMLLFPGEGHELSRSGRPQHRQQRFEAILDWWQRHLPTG